VTGAGGAGRRRIPPLPLPARLQRQLVLPANTFLPAHVAWAPRPSTSRSKVCRAPLGTSPILISLAVCPFGASGVVFSPVVLVFYSAFLIGWRPEFTCRPRPERGPKREAEVEANNCAAVD
jgi:hypothetical protein